MTHIYTPTERERENRAEPIKVGREEATNTTEEFLGN